MRSFRIRIGNLVADIHSIHGYVKRICEEYYSFDVPNCRIDIDPAFLQVERDSIAELKTMQMMPEDTEDWFIEVYALLHKILPQLPRHDMLFMHGSAILYHGKAYIFAAPSGTGKSTHTRLWKEIYGDEVTVINDDKPFLAFRDDKVYVCGTPWRGKHNIGQNIEAELGAICILRRGSANEINRLPAYDAVNDVIKQCNLQAYKDNSLIALDLIDKLLKIVPVYRLSCTPDIEAVDVCCKEMVK